MKCLTGFSEAVGPGFVFDRVSVLKDHYHLRLCQNLNACFLHYYRTIIMHRFVNK